MTCGLRIDRHAGFVALHVQPGTRRRAVQPGATAAGDQIISIIYSVRANVYADANDHGISDVNHHNTRSTRRMPGDRRGDGGWLARRPDVDTRSCRQGEIGEHRDSSRREQIVEGGDCSTLCETVPSRDQM